VNTYNTSFVKADFSKCGEIGVKIYSEKSTKNPVNLEGCFKRKVFPD
jgi:hypothetical protein